MENVYHRLVAALERRGIAHDRPIPAEVACQIAEELGLTEKNLRNRSWELRRAAGDAGAATTSKQHRYRTDPVYAAKARAYSRLDRRRNPAYHVFKNTRSNARSRGLAFELTREQVVEMLAPMLCSATGLPLVSEWDGTGRNPWWPSLDQIDPCGGYTPGNVRVVCWAYNVMKGELGDDEVRRFAAALLRRNSKPKREVGEQLMARRFGKNRVTAPAHLLCTWRVSARDRDLTFGLTRRWLEERLHRGTCEVTGLPLSFEYDGRAHRNPLVPSADRIDGARGYEEANVRIVCGWYNYARQDWPDELVLRVAKALVKRRRN